MTEQVTIRRFLRAGVVVNVTQIKDGVRVHWAERVLGPTPDGIRTAVRFCRAQCAMLAEGLEE